MKTDKLKSYLKSLIENGSSQVELARKCGVSTASINLLLHGKYGAKEEMLCQTIARALDWVDSDWVIVESIKSYQMVATKFREAKEEHIWIGISSKAGIGKTESLKHLYLTSSDNSVIYIQARSWSARQFLIALHEKTIGKLTGSYKTIDKLIDALVDYFRYQLDSPILIIDEADKLRPGALASLIPIYNGTEGALGAILSGTDNLEKEIKRGARLEKKGYDEIDSRLGREFVHLLGATKKDVENICYANGVTNPVTVDLIWGNLDKVKKESYKGSGQMYNFVDDFRRLMRMIKTERLIAKRKG